MQSGKTADQGIGFLLADISRLLRRDFDRRVRELGMTQAQWRAIAHISRDEGINQSALAERLEVQPITIARLIDRMEAAGWVTRCADASDRRASLLYLTAKARPVLTRLSLHADDAREAMMQGISRKDRKALMAGLEKMKLNLNAAHDNAEEDGDGNRRNTTR